MVERKTKGEEKEVAQRESWAEKELGGKEEEEEEVAERKLGRKNREEEGEQTVEKDYGGG